VKQAVRAGTAPRGAGRAAAATVTASATGGAIARQFAAALAAAVLSTAPALATDAVRLSSLAPSAAGRGLAEPLVERRASPFAQHLAQLINDYRASKGLGPLELVPDLGDLASEHTFQMAEHRRLSHDGFRDRFDRSRARVCVENVGVNFPHAEAQLDGWRASPGHHRNLLEAKVARMGIARSGAFVTFFACS